MLAHRFLDNKDDIEKLRRCFAGLWNLEDSEILEKAMETPELFVLKPQREGGGPPPPELLSSLRFFPPSDSSPSSFVLPSLWQAHAPSSGNNIYGEDVRETLAKLQQEGSSGLAAYILMQRIFPASAPTHLVRDGICRQDFAISELGIYGAYLRWFSHCIFFDFFFCFFFSCWLVLKQYMTMEFLTTRNKDRVLVNDQCGYLMRTKVSSSNEGGVAAGFAVLDSIYLTWLGGVRPECGSKAVQLASCFCCLNQNGPNLSPADVFLRRPKPMDHLPWIILWLERARGWPNSIMECGMVFF